jgi:hypothetical protein
LLTVQNQYRVGARRTQGGYQPGKQQGPFVIAGDVHEPPKLADVPALYWLGQRLHPPAPAKLDWWVSYYLPAFVSYLDCPPFIISQAQVEAPIVFSKASTDGMLRAVKEGLPFQHSQRILNHL